MHVSYKLQATSLCKSQLHATWSLSFRQGTSGSKLGTSHYRCAQTRSFKSGLVPWWANWPWVYSWAMDSVPSTVYILCIIFKIPSITNKQKGRVINHLQILLLQGRGKHSLWVWHWIYIYIYIYIYGHISFIQLSNGCLTFASMAAKCSSGLRAWSGKQTSGITMEHIGSLVIKPLYLGGKGGSVWECGWDCLLKCFLFENILK
jgi:hypothetical protein